MTVFAAILAGIIITIVSPLLFVIFVCCPLLWSAIAFAVCNAPSMVAACSKVASLAAPIFTLAAWTNTLQATASISMGTITTATNWAEFVCIALATAVYTGLQLFTAGLSKQTAEYIMAMACCCKLLYDSWVVTSSMWQLITALAICTNQLMQLCSGLLINSLAAVHSVAVQACAMTSMSAWLEVLRAAQPLFFIATNITILVAGIKVSIQTLSSSTGDILDMACRVLLHHVQHAMSRLHNEMDLLTLCSKCVARICHFAWFLTPWTMVHYMTLHVMQPAHARKLHVQVIRLMQAVPVEDIKRICATMLQQAKTSCNTEGRQSANAESLSDLMPPLKTVDLSSTQVCMHCILNPWHPVACSAGG